MDKVEDILEILNNLRKVWHDDTELGYLCKMYEDYLKESKEAQ